MKLPPHVAFPLLQCVKPAQAGSHCRSPHAPRRAAGLLSYGTKTCKLHIPIPGISALFAAEVGGRISHALSAHTWSTACAQQRASPEARWCLGAETPHEAAARLLLPPPPPTCAGRLSQALRHFVGMHCCAGGILRKAACIQMTTRMRWAGCGCDRWWRRPGALVPARHKELPATQRKVAVAGHCHKVLLWAGAAPCVRLQKVRVRSCCALHVTMNA